MLELQPRTKGYLFWKAKLLTSAITMEFHNCIQCDISAEAKLHTFQTDMAKSGQ